MRTATALIVIGLLSFALLSSDLVAKLTGRPFMGASPNWDGVTSGRERSRTENLDLNGVQTVRVETMNGEITVRGPNAAPDTGTTFSSDRDAVRITERGEVKTTITRQGDTLVLRGESPRVLFNDAQVRFDLSLRRAVRLELQTSNGEIRVSGQAETVSADSSNGEISVTDAGRSDLKLHTGNGEIQVRNVQGRLEADTANGKIELQNAQPGDLKLNSDNGDITVQDVQFTSGSNVITSANGTISLRDARDASFRIETSSGAIVLERAQLRPGSTSQAINSSGDIRVTGLNAADGLTLSGGADGGSQDIQLPGFTVRAQENTFTAERDGRNPASLSLEASGGSIQIRP